MNVGNQGGPKPNAPGRAIARRGQTPPTAQPPAVPTITNTRCKVCNSPYRREIDMCLVSGWGQAMVMRHFNQVLGEEFFNKMNISRHAKFHLDAQDAAVRRIIEKRAEQFMSDVDAIEGSILTKGAVLDTMIQRGVDGIHAGLVEIKGQDILSAVKMLDEMESQWKESAIDELLNEFRAFAAVVKDEVGEDRFREIYAKFEHEMDNKTRPALMPLDHDGPPADVEGEVTGEEDDEL